MSGNTSVPAPSSPLTGSYFHRPCDYVRKWVFATVFVQPYKGFSAKGSSTSARQNAICQRIIPPQRLELAGEFVASTLAKAMMAPRWQRCVHPILGLTIALNGTIITTLRSPCCVQLSLLPFGAVEGTMRLLQLIFLLLSVMLSLLLLATRQTSAAGSQAFCGTWLQLCNKTCPQGPGKCGGVCANRYKACLSSGCFFFNTPGPRCQGNSKDDIATVNVRDRLQKGLPVGCGPGFGGRSCD